jgi:PKHD-type hydroxylase
MIVLDTKEVDLQNYYYYNQGFSADELDRIYDSVDKLPFQNGVVVGGENPAIRTSSIKWVPNNDEYKWIYDKLITMIKHANEVLWNFDLYSALDDIQYTEYYAEQGGHYTWHQDIGPGWLSKRKVSITVQLSDADEYEGGDLEYWRGGSFDNVEKAPRGKGVVFIFPSFMMHRVAPVTKGTRRSFVLWVGGEHYK